jgi:hypothetical protein
MQLIKLLAILAAIRSAKCFVTNGATASMYPSDYLGANSLTSSDNSVAAYSAQKDMQKP